MSTCKPALRRGMTAVRVQEQTKESVPNNGKLTQAQLDEASAQDHIGKTQVGDISPQKAEMRADMGSNWNDGGQMQAFDGPAPETINGRTAMLGVLIAVLWELRTGMGLEQQIQDHPYAVVASFVIISIATYVPLLKGVTRKESYANGPWTAQAENWNGRSLHVVRVQEQTKDESFGNSRLTQQQLNEIGKTAVGDISPHKADMRADMGVNWNDGGQMQAFDGPAPETINERTAMLGVLIAVLWELRTGMGLEQQVRDHPYAVIASRQIT
ncbi:MAG: hypothetical protein WDW38_008973 [Sanguina aurantia]